jgi:hypothetical protein
MKQKILLIIFLTIIGLSKKTIGQGSCFNATLLVSMDSNYIISANTTEAWYIYYANTPNLSVQINTMEDTNIVTISGLQLFTGNCSNLTQIASSSNANNLILSVNNLYIGNTYYIKITKPVTSYAVKFSVNDNPIILNCADLVCHDSPSLSCDLVCNGNFEYCSFIPTYISQIGLACPWGSVNGANPDYFNGDASGNPGFIVGVPSNDVGFQYSFNNSLGDKGYAGFGVSLNNVSNSTYNEYIYQKLKYPLLKNLTYKVSLKVSRADYYKYAVDNIGVFLSENNPYVSGPPGVNTGPISYIPSQTWIWKNNNPPTPYITECNNWVNIEYFFTPQINGIQYIVIGGFGDPNYTIVSGNVNGSYYYIDEVHINAVDQNFTITANPNPTCIGQNTSLNNNLNTAINWSAAPNCNISCPTNCVTAIASPSVNTVFTGILTISPGCTKTATTTVNVVPPPVPTITGKTAICVNNAVIYTTEPNMTNYTWNIIGGTIISGNGTNTVTVVWNTNGNQTISVNYSNGVCMANSPTVLNVTVGPPPVPIISGNNNNCDAYQTPALLTNYTVTNVNPNYSYTWYVNQGTINGTNNNTNVNIMWNQNILNLTPATITVVVSDLDNCTNTTSLDVYNCCYKPGNILYYDQILTQPPSNGNFFINGTVVFDCNINISSSEINMGPYAKIVVTPNHQLVIDNSSLIKNYCEFMWDGIYASDQSTTIELKGNSTIKDAINGLVSENGGIIKTDNAILKDNYYNIKISNTLQYPPTLPYLPYNGSVKKTEFIGNNSLPFPPYNGQKTYDGIHCTNVYNPFTIGDETSNYLINKFSNMRFGIYLYDSDIEVYNCSFKNIYNGGFQPLITHKYYPEGAIYAIHNGIKLINPSNLLIAGGMGLKRNYFESCNTGIYSFQYVNTLNNNDFKDCYNGISLVNISSGTEIKENMVYGSSASTVTPGKGISVRNTHSPLTGINCLIEENHITNKQTGISLVNVKSTPENTTRVLNNIMLNFTPVFPTSANISSGAYVPVNSIQTGILAEGCDGIQIKENTINRNFPVIAIEKENIRGIRISESKNAYVFHNFMMHQGSGIFTNGLLTNTRFDCNILDHDWHGFYFGLASLISDQGAQNVFNPHNAFVGNYSNGQEKLYSPIGNMINGTNYNGTNVPAAKWYYFDNAGLQYSTIPYLSIGIDYIVNNNATHYCESVGGDLPLPDPSEPIESWEDREEAMGEIVRDERLYGYMEEYYRTRDREYVYEILRKDPSILYMGTSDDNLYQQFYAEMHNSEAEKVLQLREAMYKEDLAVALEKLGQIAGEDQINLNRRMVDGVYFNTWAQSYYNFTSDQENILKQIAYLTPYSGGDAVYTARALLNIDPDDLGLDFFKPNAEQPMAIKENKAKVFPNPAREQITIQFDDIINSDAEIEIYGNLGNLILKETLLQGNYTKTIDISKLKSGLYFYNVSLNTNKVTSGKITILSK